MIGFGFGYGYAAGRVGAEVNQMITVDYAIDGLDFEKTNYNIPLSIHRGSNSGDVSTDVFMDGKCKTDFSDVYFEDSEGNKLDFYLVSHVNSELINMNTKVGTYSCILQNGDILSTNIIDGNLLTPTPANALFKSVDNGNTWVLLYTGNAAISTIFEDSRGYLFINMGYGLWRSINSGVSFTKVIDESAISGEFLPTAISENINGDLYVGRYQTAFSVKIYKSTDDGASWQSVYSETTHQHVHGLICDPYTGYIYAGLDAGGHSLIRSIDNGNNWTEIYNINPIAFYCGEGFRLFGSELPGGNDLLRTEDDIIFTNVLPNNYTYSWIKELNGVIFCGAVSLSSNQEPAIYQSNDDGRTWQTVKMFEADSQIFAGYHLAVSNVGIPNTTFENTLLLGRTTTLSGARLYSGGSHYQALFNVKIPILPVEGITIKVKSRGAEISTINTFNEPVISDLLLRYKLDEGSGTTILDSVSTNHGVLANGNWNNYPIRKIGNLYPIVSPTLKSCKLKDSRITVTGSGLNPEFQLQKNFSVLLWIKSSTQGALRMVLKGNDWQFCFLNSRNQLAIYNGANYITQGGYMTMDGKSHLVGMIIDNSTPAKVTFTVDGLFEAPIVMPRDFIISTANITMADAGYGPFNFDGDMEDIRIYNRALTSNEVNSIYKSNNL